MEQRYWEQFMKSGSVADYLDYKRETGKISPCGKNRQDRGNEVESDRIDGAGASRAAPVGEYDRRVVILTKEQGKISAFARGARRPNSPLVVAVNLSFGEFTVYAGRSSYTVQSAKISTIFGIAGRYGGRLLRILFSGIYVLLYERGK